jgi:diaminobutyrate-2-oxoglutarate transaminase
MSESKVNVYGSALGKVLRSASGPFLFDVEEAPYFDLFSSAGVANFGHNHPGLKAKLIEYLNRDGLVHGLDYYTESKDRFIRLLENRILPAEARGRYRYYFSPPAGTLAMEAAIKYARKATGRRELGCFTNGFHGLTYNALSLTGNVAKRNAAYSDLQSVVRLPYEGYLGPQDYAAIYRKILTDRSSGHGVPAALVFETIQAEGGCHSASREWYEGVLSLCRELGMISIVDDIQAGCGRTGEYFSFQGLSRQWPDVICLAKSLSGLGLPFSLVLIRKELDRLAVGENSGTFRGNTLAAESAGNALELFTSAEFQARVKENRELLDSHASQWEGQGLRVRGRGLLRGIALPDEASAHAVVKTLRESRVLVETCGGAPDTVKIMPPLVTEPALLGTILEKVTETLNRKVV